MKSERFYLLHTLLLNVEVVLYGVSSSNKVLQNCTNLGNVARQLKNPLHAKSPSIWFSLKSTCKYKDMHPRF